MNKKICVYTCITGDYDDLQEVTIKDKNVEFLCFTNNKTIKSKTWKIIQIKNDGLDNCRLARKIKTIGHPIIDENYDISVWIDGSMIWEKPPTEFVKTFLKDSPLAIFKHCSRDNVHDEAIACLRLRKDSKEIIEKTLNFYKTTDFPDDNGLCESTIYIKRHNDPTVKATMKTWFEIIEKYSRRDQLSFNYAAWKNNLNFNYINLNVWHNPWLKYIGHKPKIEIKNCHIYYNNPDHEFNFDKYYIYDYQQKNNNYQLDVTIPNQTPVIEISFSDIVGTNCQNILITPKPNRFTLHGMVKYEENTACCLGLNTMRIYRDFKKGQKLHISLDMEIMNRANLENLISYQYAYNELLQGQIENSQKTVSNLQTELNSLINSKGWQALEKLRKFIPHKNSSTNS